MDRDEFAERVRRHQPVLSRFVARYLRSRDDQDEVVQDTFLRAWQQIARFREGTNFVAWVMTIARFLCMARMKDRQRHPDPAPLEPHLHPPAPPAPENLEKLKEAVERLPLPQREVLAMRFFDGLDYRAIADVTGDSEVTLRSRMHDALEKLKAQLGAPKA
jgi:RNA polymerase sigma-70 factor (ECF subfamily)